MEHLQKKIRNAGILKVIVALVLIVISLAFNDSESNLKAIPAIIGLIIGIYGVYQIVQSFRKYISQ